MSHRIVLPSILLISLLFASQCSSLRAAIVLNGDVDPANETDWNSSTDGAIGITGHGTLDVNEGSDFYSSNGYIGYDSGSTGVVTIDGAGSKWTNSSGLIVGYAGIGTLNITADGTVCNSAGHIGFDSGSMGAVTVDGAGSVWRNQGELYVGHAGSGTLTITADGTVYNTVGHIGFDSGSTGVVTVDGAGSMWSNYKDLYVGNAGSGTLDISAGGSASNTTAYIGFDSGSTGVVTVDGEGSTWTNKGDLFVGNLGDGTLEITHGASVMVKGDAYVAYQEGSTGLIDFGDDGGTLYVGTLHATYSQLRGTGTINLREMLGDLDMVFDATTGPLCMMTTLNDEPDQFITLNIDMSASFGGPGDLWAGHAANGSLNISDGVKVYSATGGLGYAPGSMGQATVNGDGSLWNIMNHLYIGHSGIGSLTISGGAAVKSFTGHIGHDIGSIGKVTVDGDGSTWTNFDDLFIGNLGDGTLEITHGSSVVVGGDVFVAHQEGSAGLIDFGDDGGTLSARMLHASHSQLRGAGTITVRGLYGDLDLVFDATTGTTGTGTLNHEPDQSITFHVDMSETSYPPLDLWAGYEANGSVSIRDGIVVRSASTGLGYSAGSVGQATIDGHGSTWTTSSELYVGKSGTGFLDITDGASVVNSFGYIGCDPGSTGVVTIDGAGSTWTNSKTLYVGRAGSGTLTVTGGTVTSSGVCIGDEAGSTGAVTVDGASSTLLSTNHIFVGLAGNGTLSITNGANVSVDNTTYVAYEAGSTGLIDFGHDGGTLTTGTLYHFSSTQVTGTGTIDTRGLVGDYDLVFDSTRGANQTFLLASEPGQNVTIHLDVTDHVGSLGAGSRAEGSLSIREGVLVKSIYGYLGLDAGSEGTAEVDGVGSGWSIQESLSIGDDGNGALTITGGAIVGSKSGAVGRYLGSTGQMAVDGDGSSYTCDEGFSVGRAGNGMLAVTAGGAVISASGFIGHDADSTGTVTVGGNGSAWANTDDLYVGNLGEGSLNIANGGTVTTKVGHIGQDSVATGTVTVDGPGATWAVALYLHVGENGSGTLSVVNGGAVTSYEGCVGHDANSTGVVHISGIGSRWETDRCYVGEAGSGSVHISNGGTLGRPDQVLSCVIGGKPGTSGAMTVDGIGSAVLGVADIIVGHSGSGTLNITNGAIVEPSRYSDHYILGRIGNGIDSTGVVNISGAGSRLSTKQRLVVGFHGTGMVCVSDGGRLETNVYGAPADSSAIGSQSASTGTVIVDGPGSIWTNKGGLVVGASGNGTLTITSGGCVTSQSSHIAYNSGVTGFVTVDGVGTTWTTSGLYVGYDGIATLRITNGGLVDVAGNTCLTQNWMDSGTLDFGSAGGGELRTKMFCAIPSYVLGNGTITAKGLISDADLYFDATRGATGTFALTGASQDVLLNLDLSNPKDPGDLGLGVTEGSGGSVEIRDGATVHCETAYLGYIAGSSGTATVDGSNASWINRQILVGYGGAGSLSIRNEATVSCSQLSTIGNYAGSSGIVKVDGSGSTWTSPVTVGAHGDGALEITNGGKVFFEHYSSSIGSGEKANGLVVVDGDGSIWENRYGNLTVGSSGHAGLLISNGGSVRCDWGYIGNRPSSEGTVVVDGAGSKWSIGKSLRMGESLGTGTLQITNGGTVVHTSSIQYGSEIRKGGVLVDGVGSAWLNVVDLGVGRDVGAADETATLSIVGGGVVDASGVSVGHPRHLLTVDVGHGSLLSLGGGIGEITNDGTVRVVAGAGVAPGDYRPIAAGSWTGDGVYQGVGGVWDAREHKMVVSAAAKGVGGEMIAIDLAQVQRVFLSDDSVGGRVGASFLWKAGDDAELDFTATAVDLAALEDLAGLLDDGEAVRGAWAFEIGGAGYAVGDPVYLSFEIAPGGGGAGIGRSDLNVWHYDGGEWTTFDAIDLTFDGQYASFTVTDFSGYAVSVVPEPGSLVMLAGVALGVLVFWQRRKR